MTPPSDLLDVGEDLEGGDSEGRFDLDVGVLAVAGPVRLGGVVRNLRESDFSNVTPPELGLPALQLSRQIRVGAAFDPSITTGLPLTVAIDADLEEYDTASGARRVVAIGAEQWFLNRRLGVRGGGRFNRAGAEERSASAGVSVAVRAGVYVDAHIVRGGSADDEGWGLATRVSF